MTQAFHGDLRFLPGVRSGEQKHPDVDKRSADPLNQLGRRLDAICTRAVDPLQIAAALESEGITDAYAAKHFGLANVFELADLLFVNVPLRVVGIEARGTAKRSPVRELSHGLLFALPALFYPALVSVVGPAWAAAALALAVVGGWGWSQLVIRVAYLMSGTGSPSGSVVWLRLSTLAGIALVAASGWLITWLLAGPSSLIALASGQMAYHMAAAILIHYQRERLLLLCLLPGLVAGGLFLSPLSLPTAVVIAMIAVSLALSLAFALGLRPEQAAAAKSFRFVTFAELQAAIPFLLYGLLCALLVSYDSLRFRDWIGSTSFGLTIAPLVLSMGVLEWQLRVFRERVAIALARSTSVTHLGSEVWRLFVAALARFALILGALSAGAFVLIFTQGRNVEYLAATLLANWVLGCAFFVSFALISQNRVALVTWFGAVAFGLHLLDLTAKLPWTMSGATEASSYLLACLVFAMLQLSVARSVLCEIHYYRYDLHLSRYGRQR